jgi:medium-chain acyl-[acyl-carrier-protein] hydrolase
MLNIWKDNYIIRSFDCGVNKQAKLHSMVNYFQESAQNHATHLGFGYDDLKRSKQFWVLSRLHLRIIRWPYWGDEVFIETWPKATINPFAYRDFEILDKAGAKLIIGTTGWLMLDIDSRRPIRDIFALREKIKYPEDKSAIEELPPKLSVLKNGSVISSIVAGFADLDMNGHINNTVYVEWIVNALPFNFYDENEINELSINYLTEVRPGDKIVIHAMNENREWKLEASRELDGISAFRAKIGFSPIKVI